MGRLMDRAMYSIDPLEEKAQSYVRAELEVIRPVCRWTGGRWEELGLEWNEVQNVPKHIAVLSNFLIREYTRRKRETA